MLAEIARQQQQGKTVIFRADAAFAKPEIYEPLEERDVKYAIRLPANHKLERNITRVVRFYNEGARPRSGAWKASRW